MIGPWRVSTLSIGSSNYTLLHKSHVLQILLITVIQTGSFGCLESNTKSNAKVFLLFSTKPGELHPPTATRVRPPPCLPGLCLQHHVLDKGKGAKTNTQHSYAKKVWVPMCMWAQFLTNYLCLLSWIYWFKLSLWVSLALPQADQWATWYLPFTEKQVNKYKKKVRFCLHLSGCSRKKNGWKLVNLEPCPMCLKIPPFTRALEHCNNGSCRQEPQHWKAQPCRWFSNSPCLCFPPARVWCSHGREEGEVSSSLPCDDCVEANRGSSMFWRHLTHRTTKVVLGGGSFLGINSYSFLYFIVH